MWLRKTDPQGPFQYNDVVLPEKEFPYNDKIVLRLAYL